MKENMNIEMKTLKENELNETTGGVDYVHDLSNYVYRTVANLPYGTCLVMQNGPGGAPIGGFQWYNGTTILVHKNFWEYGYFLAYRDGLYGYVDAKYVV